MICHLVLFWSYPCHIHKGPKCENGNIMCSFPRMWLAPIFRYSAPCLKWGTRLHKDVLMNDAHFMEPSTTPVILSFADSSAHTFHYSPQSFCYFDGSHKYQWSRSLSQFVFIVQKNDDIMAEKDHWVTLQQPIHPFICYSNQQLPPVPLFVLFLFMELKDHTGGLGCFSLLKITLNLFKTDFGF